MDEASNLGAVSIAAPAGGEMTPEAELSMLRYRVADLERQIEELAQSEARYRTMIRLSSEGIWRVEHDHPIPAHLPIDEQVDLALRWAYLAECNDAMARMYGSDRADSFVGVRLSDVFDPKAESTWAFLRAFFHNGYVIDGIESEEIGVDGNPRWFRKSFFGVVEDGFLVRIWGSQRDITDSRLAARQLRFQTDFLRNVIESIPAMIYVKAVDGRYLLANETTARIYGTDRLMLESDLATTADGPGEPAEIADAAQAALRTGQDMGPAKRRVAGADGRTYWLDGLHRPIAGPAGEPSVLFVGNDVTRNEATEQEMVKIRRAIDYARDAITITDLDGYVAYANPAFEKLTGYSREVFETLGPEAIYVDPSQSQAVRQAIEDVGTFEGEVLLRHRDGRQLFIHQRVDLVDGPDGAPSAMLAVRTDVGERKRLEEQLRQADKMAALGELTAGVAHELNNPVAAISAHAQLLARSPDEGVRKRADGILRMVERASRIGKSLLTFSRSSVPDLRHHRLNDIVRESLLLCEARIRHAGIEAKVDLASGPLIVFVDESQIEQIVVNLLNNAAYSMRETPGAVLSVRTWEEGGMGHVSVADSGEGIPEDIQARVFEPFFTTKPAGEGTGLGLSICHGLAVANRGVLQFRSEKDQGAVFTLTLPLTQGESLTAGEGI